MSEFPYRPIDVNWKRPPVDREVLRECTQRSDWLGLVYSLGTLAILGASGTFAYAMYTARNWPLLAVAIYIHGGFYAFQPQTHEFSHGTVFRTAWLNNLFKRIFGLVFWTSNSALYKMSHVYHHRYTLHRESEGEEVHPRPETTEQLLWSAMNVVDLTGFVNTVYDRIYSFFKPFERNPRRGIWWRYVYTQSPRTAQRDLIWTERLQFLFHVLFGIGAVATGHGFLIVVVTLPLFYGGKWYAMAIHDTMHVGRQPEVDDFRLCCRTVTVDPISSFLYWHMEYHTQHHAFAAVPCYRLKRFYGRTREHWEPRQTLVGAWREMNRHSAKLLGLPVRDG